MAATRKVAVEETATNGHIRGLLSAADILAADDLPSEYVEVPEWGGTVRVVGLSGGQRNEIGALVRADSKRIGEDAALALFQFRVIAAALVDDEDNPLFTQDDIDQLAKKSGLALQRVYESAARLSGIGEDAVEKAAADLKATPSDATGGD